MIPLPHPNFFINKFVDVKLPTKKQLFGRIGATAPGTYYSGDQSVDFGLKPTEMADSLVNAAEAYDPPKEDLPAEDEKV